MSKKSVILGIAGQDGSYLAEHLLDLGHEVHGMVRRNSTPEHQESRIAHLGDKIKTYYGDLTDFSTLVELFTTIKPDYIFNLAAQSHVRISFDLPIFTGQVNGLGVTNALEAYRRICPSARFYQASSSEMFGNSVDTDLSQRETTPMRPVSPYGAAKLYGYNMTRIYRDSYNLFAANGILFNHESGRRGSNFVTQKVVKGAVMIRYHIQNKLELGNLDAKRDWGHSRDYVRAMVKILNHTIPDDFVIATGQTRSVREMCEYVFGTLGLCYEEHIVENPKYRRPNELNFLRGDSTKAQTVLNWKPEISFDQMMDEMIRFWTGKVLS